jgi:hypothetical protein
MRRFSLLGLLALMFVGCESLIGADFSREPRRGLDSGLAIESGTVNDADRRAAV